MQKQHQNLTVVVVVVPQTSVTPAAPPVVDVLALGSVRAG